MTLGEAEDKGYEKIKKMQVCVNKCVYPSIGLSFLLSSSVCQPTLSEGHQWNWKVHFAESKRCRGQIAHCLSNLVSVL